MVEAQQAPLRIDALSHSYDRRVSILEGVNLSVGAGELVAVLGASGSGKTTLLRAVAGFVTPSGGSIRVGGEVVAAEGRERVSAEKRRVGMVFQDYALFGHMSVADNVAFGLYGQPREVQRERVASLLALIGLPEMGARRPAQLSGGQQQRVALARALAPRPRLLLLDEPFANLDAVLRRGLGDSIRDILRQEQVSAMLVTHDRREALGLADRVAVLGAVGDGQPATLLQCDSPERVYHEPGNALVATLTGEVVFLPASLRADADSAETALGVLPLSRHLSGASHVALRPEQLRFEPGEEGPCEVTGRDFQGARYGLRVRTPAGPVALEWSAGPAPSLGQRGRVVVEGRVWACRPHP